MVEIILQTDGHRKEINDTYFHIRPASLVRGQPRVTLLSRDGGCCVVCAEDVSHVEVNKRTIKISAVFPQL